MSIATGIDMVHIPSFAQQLEQPGTTFHSVFTPTELRRARRREPHRQAETLAGRWAAKEALVKAWSQALYGHPPVIAEEDVNFADIEVRADAYSRVALDITGETEQHMLASIGGFSTALSISHDGDYAIAVVILTTN